MHLNISKNPFLSIKIGLGSCQQLVHNYYTEKLKTLKKIRFFTYPQVILYNNFRQEDSIVLNKKAITLKLEDNIILRIENI